MRGRTPIRTLQGFMRIHLKPGEKQTVRFELDPRQLSVVRENGDRMEEAGKLDVYAGGGQPLEKALSRGETLHAAVVLTGGSLVIEPFSKK
jgi:beta-glucosidase